MTALIAATAIYALALGFVATTSLVERRKQYDEEERQAVEVTTERIARLEAEGRVLELADTLKSLSDAGEEVSAELLRLGNGVERIAMKYGSKCPEVADALHKLLRGVTS